MRRSSRYFPSRLPLRSTLLRLVCVNQPGQRIGHAARLVLPLDLDRDTLLELQAVIIKKDEELNKKNKELNEKDAIYQELLERYNIKLANEYGKKIRKNAWCR